ncbi:MAG: hypothetical protein JSV25_01970 [Spirochaetota bacterium]|nr:MAG: hypothetical protein JSV25_01970 [Spirochaetota bacterium]
MNDFKKIKFIRDENRGVNLVGYAKHEMGIGELETNSLQQLCFLLGVVSKLLTERSHA